MTINNLNISRKENLKKDGVTVEVFAVETVLVECLSKVRVL